MFHYPALCWDKILNKVDNLHNETSVALTQNKSEKLSLTSQPIDVVDNEVVGKSEHILRVGNLEGLVLQRGHVVGEVVRQIDGLRVEIENMGDHNM